MMRPAEARRRPVCPTTVLGVRAVGPGVFVLGFAPVATSFRAGESLRVTLPGADVERDYSLYSGERDPRWEILVREVDGGALSPRLRACRPGDRLLVSVPGGDFVLDDAAGEHLFVATGTGIAPFHSMVRSRPDLRYRLLHGVRTAADRHDPAAFASGAYLPCVSREPGAGHHGRVTDRLPGLEIGEGTVCHLCGRNEMVYAVFHLLRARGVPEHRIRTEIYF